MMTSRRVLAVPVVLLTWATAGGAQSNSALYAGGTLTGYFQARSDQPLGGSGWGGSVLFGGWVSRRIGIEFEPSFGPTFSNQSSTAPLALFPDLPVTVVASRRDSFWSGQLRVRAPVVEPVFGVAYRHSRLQRYGTTPGGASPSSLDSNMSEDGVAAVLGVDAPLKVASHVDILPTFRVMIAGGRGPIAPQGAPVQNDAATGLLTLRYGAGVRVRF